MPNITADTLGTGHYPEDVFEEQIYEQGIDQDWWIKDPNYRNLIHQLQNINFEFKESWHHVVAAISLCDKDLPAHPGVRFPAATGVLGTTSYSPLRYVRVPQSLKPYFVGLNRIAYHVVFSCRGDNCADIEGLGYAADQYGQYLGIVATTVVETYTRAKFEREFNLDWIPNPGGYNHHSASSQLGSTEEILHHWL